MELCYMYIHMKKNGIYQGSNFSVQKYDAVFILFFSVSKNKNILDINSSVWYGF
jgi:hypothetical protein